MKDFYHDERPLHRIPYAQAKVRRVYLKADSPIFLYTQLISYETCVATVTWDGWLQIHALYSQTTRKHISAFMREYGLTYAIAKMCFINKKMYNIHTSELIDIP